MPFLGACAKLREQTISFVMSVRPTSWKNSDPTGRVVMEFDISVFFENLSRKIKFPYLLKPNDIYIYSYIHSLTTLTEVFPCFSSVVRQMPGLNSQSQGTDRISSELLSFVLCLSLCYATVFMLFCCYYVVLLLCCSVIICVVLCIDCVYCTIATGC